MPLILLSFASQSHKGSKMASFPKTVLLILSGSAVCHCFQGKAALI